MASTGERFKSLFTPKSQKQPLWEESLIRNGFGDFALAPKLSTIAGGIGKRELASLTEPVRTLLLPGGPGRLYVTLNLLLVLFQPISICVKVSQLSKKKVQTSFW